MSIRTKIICTIGPSVSKLDKMLDLIDAGMNVARLNFSHGTHEQHKNSIDLLKKARSMKEVPLAIMLDTKGPEIRIGELKDHEFELKTGDRWLLIKDKILGDRNKVTINPAKVLDNVFRGTQILFDDGYIISKVIEIREEGVLIEIENGGIIRSRKGVNIPDISLDLPALTDQDIEDIKFGCKEDVDLIAASFVRSPEQVLTIKKLLEEEKKSSIQVIAKIENREGVLNFDSIIQVADGIMIARGDLGVEVPISQVPGYQKMMIRKSYLAGKPSVTATQMLESMINNPRPTRAETSDVANAIYDSTSAVMLSGETAIGKFPIEVVNVMKDIVEAAENDFNYREFFDHHADLVYHDVPSALTLAAVKTAYSSNAHAIFAFTSSGSTARLLSRLRPKMPIIAMTDQEKTYHQMAFNWGVIPFLSEAQHTIAEDFKKLSSLVLEEGLASYGDLVVVTSGSPSQYGISGTTNTMMVESLGDVLVRGHIGFGAKVHGNVTMVLSKEEKKPYNVRGKLMVITKCDDSYIPLMRESLGIILQNHIDDLESEKNALNIAKNLDKPVIVRADAAIKVLKEGGLVTLDPEKALVYKGVAIN